MQKAAFSSERRNMLPSFSLFFSVFPLPVGNYRQRYPLDKQSGQDRQGHSHFALAIITSARTTITKVTVNPITNRIISFMGFVRLLLLICRQAVKSALRYAQLFSGLPNGNLSPPPGSQHCLQVGVCFRRPAGVLSLSFGNGSAQTGRWECWYPALPFWRQRPLLSH